MWGIGEPEVKGERIESHEDMTNRALVRINREGHKASLKIHDRSTGNVVFTCEYETDQPDRVVYYDLKAIADVFLKSQGLTVDKELTGIDVGFVKMSVKRSR